MRCVCFIIDSAYLEYLVEGRGCLHSYAFLRQDITLRTGLIATRLTFKYESALRTFLSPGSAKSRSRCRDSLGDDDRHRLLHCTTDSVLECHPASYIMPSSSGWRPSKVSRPVEVQVILRFETNPAGPHLEDIRSLYRAKQLDEFSKKVRELTHMLTLPSPASNMISWEDGSLSTMMLRWRFDSLDLVCCGRR
jgi:hypothetical protein